MPSKVILLIDDSKKSIVTDNNKPYFRFYIDTDENNISIKNVSFALSNGYKKNDFDERGFEYDGKPLEAYHSYLATIDVSLSNGENIKGKLSFSMGKMNEKWQGKWISDPAYSFSEKKVSPKPMTFKKKFIAKKPIKEAKMYFTALGIYEIDFNGKKLGDRYLAPGYTSYEYALLYQTYDLTNLLKEENELIIYVGGGWAVGSFVMNRTNRIYADKQAIKGEVHITYEDGEEEIIGTDSSFDVTLDSPYKDIDIYDGEEYNAAWKKDEVEWHKASEEEVKISPKLIADDGAPVIAHEKMPCKYLHTLEDGTHIFDFEQNFAGVVHLDIKDAKENDEILITHAEILKPNGELNKDLLRTAKARALYHSKEGKQEYEPRMSSFGFRYVGIKGIDKDKFSIYGVARYSDI